MKTTMMNDADVATIEHLIDSWGVAKVLEAIAQIASEKADHIRSNWQDERLASQWEMTTGKVLNASVWCEERKVPGISR